MALETGVVVAERYRVEKVLAVTEAGFLLAARHVELDDAVIVEVLSDEGHDARGAARFGRAARQPAKVMSDHVARFVDAGRLADGRPFIVIENLEGAGLDELLPEELERIVLRCLEKRREDRSASAGALAPSGSLAGRGISSQLAEGDEADNEPSLHRRAASGLFEKATYDDLRAERRFELSESAARPRRPTPKKRRPWLLMLSLLATFVGLAGWLASRPSAPQTKPATAEAPPGASTTTAESGLGPQASGFRERGSAITVTPTAEPRKPGLNPADRISSARPTPDKTSADKTSADKTSADKTSADKTTSQESTDPWGWRR